MRRDEMRKWPKWSARPRARRRQYQGANKSHRGEKGLH